MTGSRSSAVIPPASWTIVMSCGVVSIDFHIIHQPLLSAIMLWFAAAVWLLLLVVLDGPLLYHHTRSRPVVDSPVVLAGVAATAVLGTRVALGGHGIVAAVLLVIAAAGWVLLLLPVLRHWRTPTTGISFVLGVATDGLALLGATLSIAFHATWLLDAAALLLVLGLAFYGFTAARFDLRQLVSGHGDHWIAGGALAISALSAGRITEAAGALAQFAPLHRAFVITTVALWCLAVTWIVPLVVTEAVKPRPAYDVRRWATVFPLGMYAACSSTVAALTGVPGVATFALAMTWLAFGATVLVLAGLIRHLHSTLGPRNRRTRPHASIPTTG